MNGCKMKDRMVLFQMIKWSIKYHLRAQVPTSMSELATRAGDNINLLVK